MDETDRLVNDRSQKGTILGDFDFRSCKDIIIYGKSVLWIMKVTDAGNSVYRPTADAEAAEVQSKDTV